MKQIITLTLALIILGSSVPAMAALRIVATLPDLGAIAKEVAGDGATVDVLVHHAEDPHYTDAKPSHIVKLNKADVLVFNGAELEVGWLPPLVVQARNPAILPGGKGSFRAADHVKLTGKGAVDRAEGDTHPSGNPHFLWDARAGARVALALGETLAALDPGAAAGYRKRAAGLAAQLESFATQQSTRFGALSSDQRRVVTYHASMDYLLDWLGLTVVATVEPKPGISPTPAHTAKVLKAMKASGVRALLQESFYPRNTSQTLCKLGGARLVLATGGSRLADGQTYPQHLQEVSDAIYDALAR